MFSKKLKTDSYTSLIANGVIVEGKITFEGTLKVSGGVNGDIARKTSDNTECLIVDKTGVVSAQEINVFDSVINGTVSCKTLWVENTLRVSSEAQIVADEIYYRILEIEPGARIHGLMKHLDHVSAGEIT
jgi:cytoskeletal protein CcmA (bactofilin family)